MSSLLPPNKRIKGERCGILLLRSSVTDLPGFTLTGEEIRWANCVDNSLVFIYVKENLHFLIKCESYRFLNRFYIYSTYFAILYNY